MCISIYKTKELNLDTGEDVEGNEPVTRQWRLDQNQSKGKHGVVAIEVACLFAFAFFKFHDKNESHPLVIVSLLYKVVQPCLSVVCPRRRR